MSRESVERFLSATEAFNRGDIDAWLEHYDPEVIFEPQVAVMEGAYAGHDGVREFITTIGDLYESFVVELQDVRDLGDRVLALGTATGVGKQSGLEQATPLAIVASFRDGLITRFKDYADRGEAVEAAGLRE